MEPNVLEEVQRRYKQEVIDFNWEPVRKNPKRYGVLYPIIGYFVSLIAIRLISLGIFMWLFLIGGAILFCGGIYCTNGMMSEYKKNSKGGRTWRSSLIWRNVRAVEHVRRAVRRNAIKVESEKAVVDAETCIDCGTCIDECLAEAITEGA